MEATVTMASVALLAGIAFTINKIVSVIKGAFSGDKNLVLTQGVVWVVGFAVLLLAREASVSAGLLIPGIERSIGSLDVSSVLMLSLILGSSGSFAYDGLKAIDNTQSAREPSLTGPDNS